jgi:AhpD family alkylhydroperoxidase
VQKKLGMTPNMMRTMAQSPAVLEGYLNLSSALGGGSLPAKLREQIALVVGEANGCEYCLSAHSAIGRMLGLSEEEILDSRRGESSEGKSGPYDLPVSWSSPWPGERQQPGAGSQGRVH